MLSFEISIQADVLWGGDESAADSRQQETGFRQVSALQAEEGRLGPEETGIAR